MAVATGPRILLASNIERGQCGVFLATLEAIVQSHPDVELHFAAFPPLEKEVDAIADEAARTSPSFKPVSFHALKGQEHAKAVLRRIAEKYGEDAPFPTPAFNLPLSTSATMATVRDMCTFLPGWDGPSFMEVYDSFKSIISNVTPDLIVVDLLLSPAITAAWNSGIPFSYLSPNAIKDFAAAYQPFTMFWKWPSLMTGYDYPVPLYQRPLNVFHYFYMLYQIVNEPTFNELKKHVAEKTGKPMRSLINTSKSLPDYVKIFVGSLPELDIPLKSHSRIVPCGPIIRDESPILETDPKLAAWLSRGPTIYINLGSLFKLSEKYAVELATALNMVMDQMDDKAPDGPRMQVLWKLKKDGEYDVSGENAKVHAALGNKMDSDRVRIADWLECPPLAILRSGSIACAVHHGGASSYNEAVLAGIPHVILPFWTDCYEYANRVEFLGIGRKGVRKQQPLFDAAEISENIMQVINGKHSDAMKEKAVELAAVCKRHGSGPEVAAQNIVKYASELAGTSSTKPAS